MAPPSFPFITAALRQRRQQHQLRTLEKITPLAGGMAEVKGQTAINFSSNDYLGLARHPAIIEGAAQALRGYGAGSTASRLICGTLPFLDRIERSLARLKGTESALIMNSGFQANISIIPALADRQSLILADRLCHSSIIQGILLSRAKFLRYRHNDSDHLEELLRRHAPQADRVLIVTETVFSMDGDRADLDPLIAIARRHGALLMVDEAHATGVLGRNGMGLACGKDIDVVMGTFGKGLGSYGAYVACSAEIRDYFINFCTGFVYTTALPPPVLGAIDAALGLVPTMNRERSHLADTAAYLRARLREQGLSAGESTTQIVPMILGDEQKTMAMAQWLFQQKILAAPIRPPTVASGSARIRFALSSHHDKTHVDTLLDAINAFFEAHP